jgi:hypothetical protein
MAAMKRRPQQESSTLFFMKTQLAKQIKQLESSIVWIDNGMMLRTQKQRFYKLMAEQRVLDAYALIDEYKVLDSETQDS